MAIIIPTQIDKTSFHRSSGERLVLGALEKGLPNDYIVFHSVAARLVRDLGIEHSGAPRRLLEEALNIKIVR